MRHAIQLRSAVLAAAITAVTIMPVRAQSSAAYADRWTAAGGALAVDLPNAVISVRGTTGDSVRVEIRALTDEPTPLPMLQRTPNGLRLSDPDNAVALEVRIRVPQRFSAEVRGSNGGDITVDALHGALSVENSNGAVGIEGARGPVLASTSNGAIDVELEVLAPDGPYSFITSNAAVTVTLSESAPNAQLYLETDNGRILTDHELKPWPDVQRIPDATEAGRVLRAILGRGGPLIRIRTDNGDIHLLRPAAGTGS